MSKDNDLMFIVESDEDRALAALAEWDEKHQPKEGDKKKQHGIRRWVVPTNADGARLEYGGLTRQQYREAAIQEQQDRDDELDIERERPQQGYNPADYGDGLTTLQ